MELLEELGEIPASLEAYIMSEEELDVLKAMFKAAAKADSLKQFKELISNL